MYIADLGQQLKIFLKKYNWYAKRRKEMESYKIPN